MFDNLLFERRQGHFFDQLVPKILRELEEIGSESRVRVGQEGVHLMGENREEGSGGEGRGEEAVREEG